MDQGEEKINDDSQIRKLRQKTLKILFQVGIWALIVTIAFVMPI
jgi:hypothetical protein